MQNSKNYTDILKENYKNNSHLPGLMQHDLDRYDVRESYVNLRVKEKVVDDGNREDNEEVDSVELIIENLFEKVNHDEVRKVLIYGNEGTGKSTLCQNIIVQWSNSELWVNKFDYVILLSSKDIAFEEGNTNFRNILLKKYFEYMTINSKKIRYITIRVTFS